MRKLVSIFSIALLGAALSTAALADDRSPAPNFSLDDLNGDSVELEDLEGQVVVVSFWATWCRPCLQELPHMNRFYETYGDQGLTVLAIATDGPDTINQVRTTARRQRWSMPVLLDSAGDVSARLNPRGTNPFTVFIDRNGNIVEEHEGYTSGEEVHYEERIRELLAEGVAAEAPAEIPAETTESTEAVQVEQESK